jgi:predicted RecB family nuclease
MRVADDVIIYSPTDIVGASQCQFAILRRLDQKLGWSPAVDLPKAAMMARVARLGDEHEERVLQQLREQFGVAVGSKAERGVVEIETADYSMAALKQAASETVEALQAGADVVFQAAFFDGRFTGFADFLLKRSTAGGGFEYVVADTKLARRAKTSALVQIAAYADQLRQLGIPVANDGVLILGDESRSEHDIARIAPVYVEQRASLQELLDNHEAAGIAVQWGNQDFRACGRCDVCQLEVTDRRDVLLVAGMRVTQRAKLAVAGIHSIDELAASTKTSGELEIPRLDTIRAQARLQVIQEPPTSSDLVTPATLPSESEFAGEDVHIGDSATGRLAYEVFDTSWLDALPPESPGDIFFDFEGDPMWQDPKTGKWGLEYLFGIIEAPTSVDAEPAFKAFWAHDLAQEKEALRDFLAYVAQRRQQWPDMHIYHYAAYEKTALLRLAAQHALGEDEIDDLLRDKVLVDLYPVVKGAIRVGQPSYSLKKLEPFYMPEGRSGEVTNAADSVVEYEEHCQARDSGQQLKAERKLAEIKDYNRYDCESTLGLSRWLRGLTTTGLGRPKSTQSSDRQSSTPESTSTDSEDDTIAELLEFANDVGPDGRTDLQTAVALTAAAVGYFAREGKPFWWEHFDRLSQPVGEWVNARDAIVIHQVQVIKDWYKEPAKRVHRRDLQITATIQPGCSLERDEKFHLLYENPLEEMNGATEHLRGYTNGNNLQVMSTSPGGQSTIRITEIGTKKCELYPNLPMALAPTKPPPTWSMREAVAELAEQTLQALPKQANQAEAEVELPAPTADLLLRRPPRLVGARPLPDVVDGDFVAAITEAVQVLDRSVLAVQGPPGTGKTYVGARVIKHLVEQGWKVGVVSQGHSVINHLLDKVVDAGLSADRVAKKYRPESSVWTELEPKQFAGFLSEEGGRVLGGTAWDLTNTNRVTRGQLDLLVVDEAGQYALATTLAAATSAQRVLLLGDPQQLPQVSQGQHPEPVDQSALGWLSDGQTLKPELGYFLDRTYRMDPELAERVSRHSYQGRLNSKESATSQREMADADGNLVPAGVISQTVDHHDNTVAAGPEAERIVELVQEAMTWNWQESAELGARGMQPTDVLVVAPYNAQVDLIKSKLAEANLGAVPVGTVDKFQGQEAAMVLVSMTASALEDLPRGPDFLMSPNRLNVAVSRGKWRATVVHSPALAGYAPTTPAGLADLGGFLGLIA